MAGKKWGALKKEILSEIKPEDNILKEAKEISAVFCENLREKISKAKLDADIFIGGSFAKGTLVKKDKYDVDIFVRFDWEYDNLSDYIEPLLKASCKDLGFNIERVHGSRDYFRISTKNNRIILEIIPVTRIKKPKEERNVTDLSYFHVSYIKRKAAKLKDEIILAKVFCAANRVYGAESYIQGFSGYALECLILHYKSFEKMLNNLSKAKERIIIDTHGHFKKKNDVFFEVNENKLKSPVVVIDPTYKERNALASLSQETFERFQKAAREFLANPSKKFFALKNIDLDSIRKSASKKKAEFLQISLGTDKQQGDIAGTKLKKFSRFLENEFKHYFKILESEFEYDEKHGADFYLVLKSKGEIVKMGPPLKMSKHVIAFKKQNKNTYEKSGFIHSKIKINFTAKDFLNKLIKERQSTVEEMGITKVKIN